MTELDVDTYYNAIPGKMYNAVTNGTLQIPEEIMFQIQALQLQYKRCLTSSILSLKNRYMQINHC